MCIFCGRGLIVSRLAEESDNDFGFQSLVTYETTSLHDLQDQILGVTAQFCSYDFRAIEEVYPQIAWVSP